VGLTPEREQNTCTLCYGTGFYINGRGVKSDVPCNMPHNDVIPAGVQDPTTTSN
jgi:hypothetical protein